MGVLDQFKINKKLLVCLIPAIILPEIAASPDIEFNNSLETIENNIKAKQEARDKEIERKSDSIFFSDYVSRRIKKEGLRGILDGKHTYRKKAGRYYTKHGSTVISKEGDKLWGVYEDQQVEIASLSKIMSMSIVFKKLQECAISLDEPVTISKKAAEQHISTRTMYQRRGKYKSRPQQGEEFTVRKLIEAEWGVSSNTAIVALAEHISGSEKEFVQLMNDEAQSKGMTDAIFYNVTGMNYTRDVNTASAYQVAHLLKDLIEDFPEYQHFLESSTYTPPHGKWTVKSPSNKLKKAINKNDTITPIGIIKTGHYGQAGYNVSYYETDKKDNDYFVCLTGLGAQERVRLSRIFNEGLNALAVEKQLRQQEDMFMLQKNKLTKIEPYKLNKNSLRVRIPNYN